MVARRPPFGHLIGPRWNVEVPSMCLGDFGRSLVRCWSVYTSSDLSVPVTAALLFFPLPHPPSLVHVAVRFGFLLAPLSPFRSQLSYVVPAVPHSCGTRLRWAMAPPAFVPLATAAGACALHGVGVRGQARHQCQLPGRLSFAAPAGVPRPARRPTAAAAATPRMAVASSSDAPAAASDSSAAGGVTLDRVVCKFGGSSLANAERLREVTKLVKMQLDASAKPPIVVLSAMGPSTNELLSAGDRALTEGVVDMTSIRNRAYEACEELGLSTEDLVDPLLLNLDQLLLGVKFIKELSPRTMDYLVSFGERLSVRIFAAHLRQNEGLPARAVDAFDAGFRSNSTFTNAELCDVTEAQVASFFATSMPADAVAIVTGFIAKDEDGNITTLGRGGSDLTASTIGAALGVTEVQVWKDVDGILSTDPRIVKAAVPVPSVMFEEAAEMAYFGAKVLHPIAMMPAMRANIPVRVKNSYNPSHPGTVIVRDRAVEADNPVTAISVKRGVQLVDIVSTRMLGAYGFLAEVFKLFATHRVSVDMIATSEVSVSLTLEAAKQDSRVMDALAADLRQVARVSFSSDHAIVSLVANVKRSSDVLARSMHVLNEAGIEVQMISQGASKYNISMIVADAKATRAIELIHKAFFGV